MGDSPPAAVSITIWSREARSSHPIGHTINPETHTIILKTIFKSPKREHGTMVHFARMPQTENLTRPTGDRGAAAAVM
jgi:hypothetical protein